MWKRNLFFIAVIAGSVFAVRGLVFPSPVPPHASDFDPALYDAADFRKVVAAVDAAVRERIAAEGLVAAPPADELLVARRLALALTGTIPSLQEIRQFEGYQGGQRLHWWLAGLLEDRRSADYLAERFARVFVGAEDGPFIVFRRRRFVSWLSDELLNNRPYDALVRELITAEGLWTDKPATNFITVTVKQGKDNQPDPIRLGGRVARAFMGIRLDCAQCHNHPYEDWKQSDFHGLAAFFGQVRQGFTGIHDGTGEFTLENRRTGAMETKAPRVPFLPELVPAGMSRREQLAHWITDRRNPYFARVTANRAWALMFGRPMLNQVDDVSSSQDMPRALDLLAADFVAHGYDLHRLFHVIVATEAFRRDSAADHELTEAHEEHGAAFPMTRLRPEQVAGSVQQAASLVTLNAETNILIRLITFGDRNQFVERFGDSGEDEFDSRDGTIPQRLLLMNGKLVHERTKGGLFSADTRIAWQAPDDAAAVRIAFLAVLTRAPTPAEARHFEQRLAGATGDERVRRMEDLYWDMFNTTEFSWNH